MIFKNVTWRIAFVIFAPIVAQAMDVGPYEVTLQADLRGVAIDSPYTSFVNGGLGLLRYDEQHDGVRLGRIFADFTGPITDTVRADLTLSSTGDRGSRAIDVTEAYAEWRPYPHSNLRWRTKIGAFYPPISLENRAIGWETPYTISTSAINTWLGEEVRTYGVEQSMSLNAPNKSFDVSLVGAAYVWDDPMGVLIFQRGWALHDRPIAIFGSVARPFASGPNDATIEFNKEIDNRVGYYIGGELKIADNVVRVLHYDNRGDPSISDGKESAWLSRFNSIGWRYELPTDTTLIAQGLKGVTAVGPSIDDRGMLIGEYWSYFLLASQRYRNHRLSVRYDRFVAESTRGANLFNSHQTAIAWTFAYLVDINRSWQLALESLQIRGSLQQRAFMGLPVDAVERSWQLALRYSL